MPYHFLTGVTGLLGSYLVRDLMRREVPLAVLVRDAPGESAVERVERVMGRWETIQGRALPRPVLLRGDLTQPNLGLQDTEIDWVRRHCTDVIHSAASLTFVGEDKAGEPWRSNVLGTQNVLGMCRAAAITRLFYVSTAYVCGLRNDRVLEDELDVGQSFGNDYERSKCLAEKLVRNDGNLQSLTVFRPGIIVGDSQSGYTSTFHGFYTPLKIVAPLLAKFDYEELGADALLDVLGMTGTEEKNIVPVDWVSKIVTRVVCDARAHGRTYHITPESRVRVRDMAETGADTLREHLREADRPVAAPAEGLSELALLAEQLSEQMKVYQAYLRDDPFFDTCNTKSVAAEIPCPEIDKKVLRRLCRFALKNNFGWPRSPVPPIPVSVESCLKYAASEHCNGSTVKKIGLEITGPGGGRWVLDCRDGDLAGFEPGADREESAQSHLSTHTLMRLVRGELSVGAAVSTGRLMLSGKESHDRDECIELLTRILNRVSESMPPESE